MNKTTIYISPSTAHSFEQVCIKQRTEFELVTMTDENAIYEVSFTSISDLFYLGVWFGREVFIPA
jgi:hypothetical protein